MSYQLGKRGLGWYVNGEGQTLVVIPGPNEFTMGSSENEPGRDQAERQHAVRIERDFAIAAHEVTQRQYERFSLEVLQRQIDGYLKQRFPVADCPIGAVDWHRAAAYCNWLSQREEIQPDQWCYAREPDGSMRAVPDYLQRSGYRLPTEAEWEFACRARTTTARFFGSTEKLMPHYGWYLDNSGSRAWAVGSLKANPFGLFDMLGNVSEWCQDTYDRYPEEPAIDEERSDDDETVKQARVIRGGAFDFQARILRSANRERKLPSHVEWYYGFRVARTMVSD
jgi:formylglycine-generating enzyme required for sulfatase activity